MEYELTIYLSDDSEHVFTKFDTAIKFCENEFGYIGEAWDDLGDLNSLHDFLVDDGIDSEIR